MNKKPIIALAGNPNVGKTTLFNNLTGAHQSVGNWPGVTVEHKSGSYSFGGKQFEVIDLPGSIHFHFSPDERVAQIHLKDKPDLIVNWWMPVTNATLSTTHYGNVAHDLV